MREGGLRILVIVDDALRARLILEGLQDAGAATVALLTEMRPLRRIVETDPEVIVIGLGHPGREVLDEMFQVARSVRRPVVMFVDRSDRAAIEAAVDAGVSAYVVDGLRPERVGAVLDIATRRFAVVTRLQDELDRTKQALEDRKTIDKAKAILMKSRDLTEEAAYALLRSTAMKESRRMADVAQALITAMKLLG